MAHPTDYPSQRDAYKEVIKPDFYPNVLVYNFLRENPNWALDSLVSYLLSQYSDFEVTKSIISDQIKIYIMEK